MFEDLTALPINSGLKYNVVNLLLIRVTDRLPPGGWLYILSGRTVFNVGLNSLDSLGASHSDTFPKGKGESRDQVS